MNVLDVLTISPYHVYRKCLGATNENLNFDLRVYERVNSYSAPKLVETRSLNKRPLEFTTIISYLASRMASI